MHIFYRYSVSDEICSGVEVCRLHTSCNKLWHKRSTGLSTSAGVQSYVCVKCDGAHARTASPDEFVVFSAGTVEEVNQFCYIGDVLHGGGGADRAVISRVSAAWNECRDLNSLLCNKSVPPKVSCSGVCSLG